MVSSLDIWSLGKKSGAQSIYETIKGYSCVGHSILYLTDRSGKRIKSDHINLNNFTTRVFNLNIDVEKFNSRVWRSLLNKVRWFLFQWCVLYYGIRMIPKEKVDLIYAYEIYGVPAAFLLKLIFHKPIITRFQGTILKPKLKKRLNILAYMEHTLAFFLSRYAELVLMANDGTEGDQVLKYFKVPDKRIRFWFNGVNVDPRKIKPIKSIDIYEKKINIRSKKVLLTVSRLAVWKRVDRIISIMPALVDTARKKDLILIIIGDGEEREKLEKMVQSLGVSQYIIFTGALEHEKTLSILKRADLFISLYDLSNVGNPLLEAMKLGKCIVTLNNGSTGKIISNNKNGILLEYKDLDKGLSEVILELLKNKKKRNALGKGASRYADAKFINWEKRMEQEVREIEKIRRIYQ